MFSLCVCVCELNVCNVTKKTLFLDIVNTIIVVFQD